MGTYQTYSKKGKKDRVVNGTRYGYRTEVPPVRLPDGRILRLADIGRETAYIEVTQTQ